MENGWKNRDEPVPDRIARVKMYHCGSCTNDLGLLFKRHPGQKREFPARAFLIQHRDLGNILYDTGYSQAVYEDGFLLKLYRRLNPVHVKPDQIIDARLRADGINPESVRPSFCPMHIRIIWEGLNISTGIIWWQQNRYTRRF